MTKKIRLMDEEAKTSETGVADAPVDGAVADDVYKKQLMQSHAPFRFIEFGDIDTDDVGFGNKVTILEEGEKEPVDYYILGPIELELDLYPMIVTYHSPFAQAVIGKEVGEHFTLDIEGKDTKFTVKSIEVVSPSKK